MNSYLAIETPDNCVAVLDKKITRLCGALFCGEPEALNTGCIVAG